MQSWILKLIGLSFLIGCGAMSSEIECRVTLPQLLGLDRQARITVSRQLSQAEIKDISNLHQRYRYVLGELAKKKPNGEETREELEVEKRNLEALATAYVRFAEIANGRADLKMETFFQSASEPGKSAEIELLTDTGLLLELDTSAKRLNKAYRDYQSLLRANSKIFPFDASRAAIKAYANFEAKTRERILELVQKTKDLPFQGEMMTTFPNNVRFLKISTASGELRICYVIGKDNSVRFEKFGPRENFYDDLNYLRNK